jgi:hypothetical protein
MMLHGCYLPVDTKTKKLADASKRKCQETGSDLPTDNKVKIAAVTAIPKVRLIYSVTPVT